MLYLEDIFIFSFAWSFLYARQLLSICGGVLRVLHIGICSFFPNLRCLRQKCQYELQTSRLGVDLS